jgi:hypothetical protein
MSPEISFSVYCGICGKGCCNYTDVNGVNITITCPDCDKKISGLETTIEEKDNRISELESELGEFREEDKIYERRRLDEKVPL